MPNLPKKAVNMRILLVGQLARGLLYIETDSIRWK